MAGAGLVASLILGGLPGEAHPGRRWGLVGVLVALVMLIPLGAPGVCPRGL